MKCFKIILILLIFLLGSSFTQQIGGDGEKYPTETYMGWKPSGSGYWLLYSGYGVYNDFDFMVTKSIDADENGYYSYDFWFFSQSYYWDGRNAVYTATNIRYITVSVDVGIGSQVILMNSSDIGITFNKVTSIPSLRFKSTNKSPKIWITWKNMSAK